MDVKAQCSWNSTHQYRIRTKLRTGKGFPETYDLAHPRTNRQPDAFALNHTTAGLEPRADATLCTHLARQHIALDGELQLAHDGKERPVDVVRALDVREDARLDEAERRWPGANVRAEQIADALLLQTLRVLELLDTLG